MSRKSRSKALILPLLGLAAAFSAGYYIYSKYISSENEPTSKESENRGSGSNNSGSSNSTASGIAKNSKTKPRISHQTRVAIVLSRSLLTQGVPIVQLLRSYPELVVILMPGISKEALQMSHLSFPRDSLHRVISCDTDIGSSFALKHLQSQFVVLPSDYPDVYIADLKRFVGKIVLLSHEFEESNEQFKELFFGH